MSYVVISPLPGMGYSEEERVLLIGSFSTRHAAIGAGAVFARQTGRETEVLYPE